MREYSAEAELVEENRNYQYTECKHCGQSLMEGQKHNCRKVLLAKIADCNATMLRQVQQIDYWKEQAAVYKNQTQGAYEKAKRWKEMTLALCEATTPYIITCGWFREALELISEIRLLNGGTAGEMQDIAREALSKRP